MLDVDKPTDIDKLTRQFLLGDGRNRWFDKSYVRSASRAARSSNRECRLTTQPRRSCCVGRVLRFSLLVNGAGKAAINFEHSWGDGVAIVRFMNEIFKDATKHTAVQQAPAAAAGRGPQKLQWKVSEPVAAGIKAAMARFDADAGSMDLDVRAATRTRQGRISCRGPNESRGVRALAQRMAQVLTTSVMSREGIKQAKVSPDGFLQMSFQLAYYKLYGKTVSTYESASTAAFKHGRTECIRSASVDSREFTKVFADKSSSVRPRGPGELKVRTPGRGLTCRNLCTHGRWARAVGIAVDGARSGAAQGDQHPLQNDAGRYDGQGRGPPPLRAAQDARARDAGQAAAGHLYRQGYDLVSAKI